MGLKDKLKAKKKDKKIKKNRKRFKFDKFIFPNFIINLSLENSRNANNETKSLNVPLITIMGTSENPSTYNFPLMASTESKVILNYMNEIIFKAILKGYIKKILLFHKQMQRKRRKNRYQQKYKNRNTNKAQYYTQEKRQYKNLIEIKVDRYLNETIIHKNVKEIKTTNRSKKMKKHYTKTNNQYFPKKSKEKIRLGNLKK
jgi:hypothetical protein